MPTSRGDFEFATASRCGSYPACRLCGLYPLCRQEEGTATAPHVKIIKRRRTLARGGYLFRTGEPFHAVCAVCRGSVKTCALSDDGGVQIVGFYFPGELVGLGGAGHRQHRYDAVAIERTEVCEVPVGRLQEAAEASSAFRHLMLRLLSEEIARGEERLAPFVGKKSAVARLAAYLLSLGRRLEGYGVPAGSIVLPMSRNDIGNYLGLAKETVSRLFSRFQQDGLIRVEEQQRRVWLCDQAALVRLAGETGAGMP